MDAALDDMTPLDRERYARAVHNVRTVNVVEVATTVLHATNMDCNAGGGTGHATNRMIIARTGSRPPQLQSQSSKLVPGSDSSLYTSGMHVQGTDAFGCRPGGSCWHVPLRAVVAMK
jgi:hypothetical protein